MTPLSHNRSARWLACAALIMISGLILASCDGEGGNTASASVPDQAAVAPPEEQAPEADVPEVTDAPEVEAPDAETTVPSESTDEEGGTASAYRIAVWIILGLLVIAVVAWFAARVGRGGRSSDAAPQQVEEWRTSARTAYAESRWLHDELDSPLARWRGEDLYYAGHDDATRRDDATKQAAWNQVPARMDAAREALYRVEGAAPNTEVSRLAKGLLDQLTTTRLSFDALAEAHRARRAAEADPSTPLGDLERAQAGEADAENALALSHNRLQEAILSLSAAT